MIVAILFIALVSVTLAWSRFGYIAGIGGVAWLLSAVLSALITDLPGWLQPDPVAAGFAMFVAFAIAVPIVEECFRAWGVRRVLARNAEGVFGYGLFWAFLEFWFNSVNRWLDSLFKELPIGIGWFWDWSWFELSLIATSSILIHPINTAILAKERRRFGALGLCMVIHSAHNTFGLLYLAGHLSWWQLIAIRLVLLGSICIAFGLRMPPLQRPQKACAADDAIT